MRSFVRKALYSTLDIGKQFERRIYLLNDDKKKFSIWNDVPLRPDGETDPTIFNAGIEVSRYSLGKLEVCKTEPFHPIVQDIRKNRINKDKTELRYYAQHGFFNYGMFPQTWENTLLPNRDVDNLKGDNDPLDLVELSDKTFPPGTVLQVRVLGVFALVDQGELDWKVVGLNREEADEKKIFTVNDLEEHYPRRLNAVMKWFKNYKIFDGKLVNKIHFDDAILELERAIHVIEENHQYWKELREIAEDPSKAEGEYGQMLVDIAAKFHMKKVAEKEETTSA